MPIISQTTWDKFTQEEKKEVRELYSSLINALKQEQIGSEEHLRLSAIQDRYISLFGKENLQSKPLTYEDVARELFKDRATFIINDLGGIQEVKNGRIYNRDLADCNCTSRKQAEKLLAINKLLNVARFLNGKDWKPDERDGKLWAIGIEKYNKTIMPVEVGAYDWRTEIVYFRTQQLTQQAIQILGEDIIRTALDSTY